MKSNITNREELYKAIDDVGVSDMVAALWNYIVYLESELGRQNGKEKS